MRSRMAEMEARLAPGPAPFAELALLLVATSLLWAICLPPVPTYVADIEGLSAIFHPQWLVLATLLAIPLQRVAAWRCWVGLLTLAIMASLTLAITDEAADRVELAGFSAVGGRPFWMVLAYLQALVFVIAALRGFRQRRFVRRWQRLSRKVAANASTPTRRSSPH